jgi:phosphoribosylaminoimidazole (AIR) synthetase
VIAVNSNGVHRNGLALYRWKQGYQLMLKKLTPLFIIRYGQPVDGEVAEISKYFGNERLTLLKNGIKRC